MKWRKDEDEYLIENYKSKGDLPAVAEFLDRTENSCKQRLYRIRSSQVKEEKMDVGVVMEQNWFVARSATKELPMPKEVPKGAMSTANMAPYKGKPKKTGGAKRGGNVYRHTKTGYRPDIKLNVRSGWEANFIRILNSYNIPFDYEPAVFQFPIKRGNKSYTPDIYLNNENAYIEIKGYFDKASQIKMKRFKKYFPEEWSNLTMVISKSSKLSRDWCAENGVPFILYYEDLRRIYKDRVPGWEGR